MGQVACILQTIDGFTLMSNIISNSSQDLVCLPINKAALIFHDDVEAGYKAFSEIESSFTPQDTVKEVFDKYSTHLTHNYQGAKISAIGCGFDGLESLILGLNHMQNFKIKRFLSVVTADGDPIFQFYKEMLYKKVGSNKEALLFSAVWATKVIDLNPRLMLDFNFATVSRSTTGILDKIEMSNVLNLAVTFHRRVRTSSSEIFLGEKI